MKKIVSVVAILILTGCATIPVGTSYHNSWECEKLQTGDDYACKLIPDSYYYGLNTSLNNMVYVGSAKDWGYNYHPHGWGTINFTNTKKYRIKFSSGMPAEIDAVYNSGSIYKGKVSPQLDWTSGTLQNGDEVYSGTFALSNEGFRYAKGRLENSLFIFNGDFYSSPVNLPKKGKLSHKKLNYDFDGSFSGTGAMQKGVLTNKSDGCEVKFDGYINQKVPYGLFQYNYRTDFNVSHPEGRITKNGSSVSIKFNNSSQSKANGVLSDGLIVSKSDVVRFDDEFGEFKKSSFTWGNFTNCTSKPNFSKENIILDGDNERYAVVEGVGPTDGVYRYGFENWNIDNLTNISGQLFLIKYKTKESSRNITDIFTEDSKYVSGRREVFNPKYDEVSLEVDRAYIAWQNAERETFDCPYNAANPITCAVISAGYESAANEAERKYYAAREKLNSTKRTILENVYSSYEVEKLRIRATQKATLVAAILDFRNGKIFEKEYNIRDSKAFVVINSPVADSDPDKSKIQRNSSKESEVDRWMQNQIMLSKSAKTVFDELIQTEPKKKSKRELRSYVDSLFNASLNDSGGKRLTTSYRKKDSYELEDSIMVVSNLQGSGTAFYINDNYLITNQHVVEESNFVTLRNQEGDSFTAEVIDTDIATDLALIKSNTEGIALTLHPTCDVKRREDVFTIGHPVGYEYSTTRGIISAIRTIPNPFYKATGLKKYIQIDAPISPGNSGGPLFNSSSQVIGVNTWGDNQGQNLNFSVHCSELKEFLDSNNINY
jgi:S1-C subfamily serine protease